MQLYPTSDGKSEPVTLCRLLARFVSAICPYGLFNLFSMGGPRKPTRRGLVLRGGALGNLLRVSFRFVAYGKKH